VVVFVVVIVMGHIGTLPAQTLSTIVIKAESKELVDQGECRGASAKTCTLIHYEIPTLDSTRG